MEENKYLCPECGTQMYETYDKPALNLTCPKCGCKIATTRWEKIDLDPTDYEISIIQESNPSVNHIKIVFKLICKNLIQAKEVLISGCIIFKGKANDVKKYKNILDDNKITYRINPIFPY